MLYLLCIHFLSWERGKELLTWRLITRTSLDPLFLWNVGLATFSVVGALRTLPELFHVVTTQGLYHSVCVPSFIEHDKVAGFWTLMFVGSKVPELGDTVFIVLRRQPLIFLHYYHHVTVLAYSWFSYAEYTASARWFIVMNYMVHSVMYSYFALKAAKVRVPKQVSMLITFLQISQMVVGCLVNVLVIQTVNAGRECHVSQANIGLSLAMYASYFALFGHFFYVNYLTPKKPAVKTE